MKLTYNDVKNDAAIILKSLNSDEREIPSTLHSLFLCMSVPLFCVFINALAYVAVITMADTHGWSQYIVNIQYLWVGWDAIPLYFTAVIGIFVSLMTVTQVNIYFMVPEKVRNDSVILKAIRKKIVKGAIWFVVMNVVFSLLALKMWWFLCATPASLVLLFFFINFYMSTEIVKYGLGTVIEVAGNFVKTAKTTNL